MSQEAPRITVQGLKVLKAFAAAPLTERSGADIAREAHIFAGTLYPLLIRFENAGWLASHWEDLDPVAAGRPRRRLYRITALGIAVYRDKLSELTIGEPLWVS